MRTNREIAARLRRAQKTLRAVYRRVLRDGEETAGEAWLGDHYAMLQSSLRTCAALVLQARGIRFADVFSRCLTYTRSRESVSAASLREAFSHLEEGTAVCERLPALLAAAAVCGAMRTYREDPDAVRRAVLLILSLRDTDSDVFMAEYCRAERLLREDPAGIYPHMNAETRAAYRKRLRRIAKKAGTTDAQAAAEILRKSAEEGTHIGFFLPAPPRKPPVGFLLTELLFSVGCAAAFCAGYGGTGFFASAGGRALLFVLTWPPLFAAARPLFDRLAAIWRKPRFLPALEEELTGVSPPQTMITVASVLPAASEEDALYAHLRALFASNSVPGTRLCALFDPRAAKVPSLPTDKADTDAAKRVIDRLNREFGGGFVLALRERVFSPTENEYTARERKRGAVEALVRQIRTGKGGFLLLHGDREIRDVRYLLMLDADTRLPFEGLRSLLAVALHPCNRAVVRSGRVVSGYGCFSPRTETGVRAAGKTVFSVLFAGGGGGAYHPRVSERNMDLFGTGLFCGKGLIDVNVYDELCVDAFARGEVLSHDILEGSLLRTAFVGNVILSEQFPQSPAEYWKRQSRWIRGDIQNLRYLFRPYRRHRAQARPDAVTALRLTDNARRALTPVFAAADLLASAFVPGAPGRFLFFAATASVLAPGLVSFCATALREGAFAVLRRYYARLLPAAPRALLGAAAELALLPFSAAVSLDAAARGFYRAFISKRKTLEWTPAAQSDGAGMAVFSVAVPLLFAAGLAFGGVAARAVAALILAGIPFAASDGIRLRRKKDAPDKRERETLRTYAAAAWHYFESYVNEANHWLPPDNVQFTPVRRTAKRTSPTNIGLYLTCILAAADLSLISAAEMSRRLSLALDAVEALPKYRGLLFNWYDTGTLRPLPPAFLSAVDCGNFAVCLTALREGLREYAPLGYGIDALRQRAERLLEEADLGFLYRKDRELFAVGYDAAEQRRTDACYDAYMSEARMTSLYAAAKRIVPARHWARLDRRMIRSGLHTAALSYSGTAFEYFMPTLFLPVYRDSFQWEGLRACLAAQKRCGNRDGMPYGLSESGYYAFDPDLNYAYKAHGLTALSLRRDPSQEPVFAPYASFLFLSADRKGSLRNLARFAALGAYGACGFYEAVDFSARTGREDYLPIRSYMAHHVGMSMLAAVNALTGDVFVRRFCRDRDIDAACSLLEESVPTDAPTVRRVFARRNRRPAAVRRGEAEPIEGTALYADGELSLLCDAFGRNRLLYAGQELTTFSGRSPGVFAAVGTENGIVPLTGAQPYDLTETGAVTGTDAEGLRIRSAAALLSGSSALAVPIKAENKGKTTRTVEFLWYLEPLFRETQRENPHPVFADMGVRAFFDRAGETLVFYRTGGGETGPCFGLTLGDRAPFLFTCDRERILGFDPFRVFPFTRRKPDFDCETAFRSPAAAVCAAVTLAPGARTERILLLTPGETPADVVNRCAALRRRKLPDIRRAVPEILAREPGGYSGRQLLASVFFGGVFRKEKEEETPAAPPSALWEKGISGDLPLIRVRADALPERETAAAVRLHQKLTACGIRSDLLLMTDRPADYGDETANALRALLRRYGAADPGKNGGARVLSTRDCSPAFLAAAQAAPGIDWPALRENAAVLPAPPADVPEPGEKLFGGENAFVPGGYCIGETPPRPWSHTLANPVFGTMVSYGSLGFTWALNARLNPLTTRSNDVCTGNDGEKLFFVCGGRTYDCAGNASVYFYPEKAVFGVRCGETRIRITVETDRRAMKKRLTVSCADAPPDAAFVYAVRPAAADGENAARRVLTACRAGIARFRNPANADYPGTAAVYADRDALAEEKDGLLTVRVPVRERAETLRFYLCFSRSEKGLAALAALPFLPQIPVRETFSTGLPALDELAGSLLRHQTLNTRVLARTGFFQCSGAFGFRDQLQDVMHLGASAPDRAKIQILRCAAAQFPEGDVLHWFHVVGGKEPGLRGVRTRCADDLLWLPLAAARYVRLTGDEGILNLLIRYLDGEPPAEGERERYALYRPGERRATLYEHCLRAVEHACRFGRRGLPLMGTGDWNDAFDSVGEKGEGESVWLAMFLRMVCAEFAEICDRRDDAEAAARLRRTAEAMAGNVVRRAYNGAWFLRGFYDDGAPLGDRGSDACEIDLTVQALAALSQTGTPAMRRSALEAAYERLFAGTQPPAALLFAPPFTSHSRRAGYVNDYPPGVRENGGQYTHAAVWFAAALLKEGMEEHARAVLRAILPNGKNAKEAACFANEPYALTADVRAGDPFAGAGGWSLYTGAAGTLYALCRFLSGI